MIRLSGSVWLLCAFAARDRRQTASRRLSSSGNSSPPGHPPRSVCPPSASAASARFADHPPRTARGTPHDPPRPSDRSRSASDVPPVTYPQRSSGSSNCWLGSYGRNLLPIASPCAPNFSRVPPGITVTIRPASRPSVSAAQAPTGAWSAGMWVRPRTCGKAEMGRRTGDLRERARRRLPRAAGPCGYAHILVTYFFGPFSDSARIRRYRRPLSAIRRGNRLGWWCVETSDDRTAERSRTRRAGGRRTPVRHGATRHGPRPAVGRTVRRRGRKVQHRDRLRALVLYPDLRLRNPPLLPRDVRHRVPVVADVRAIRGRPVRRSVPHEAPRSQGERP